MVAHVPVAGSSREAPMARSASPAEAGAMTRMKRALASAREPSVESAVRSTATTALVLVLASASTPSAGPETVPAQPMAAGRNGSRAKMEKRIRSHHKASRLDRRWQAGRLYAGAGDRGAALSPRRRVAWERA